MKKVTMDTVSPEEIKTHESFEALFPINDDLLAKIENDMREGAYDLSQPIILATWQGQKEPVCIDGHSRLKAAINVGIEEVPIWTHEFDLEQEAMEHAIKLQQNRRNMTDAELMVCVALLDSKRHRGGDRRSEQAKSKPSSDGNENSRSVSAKKTADKLGVSSRKVEKARTVLGKGDPDTVKAVQSGKMSINKAYQEVQEKAGKKSAEKIKVIQEQHYVIPEDLLAELEELGGLIDEHIDVAITAYLDLPEQQRRQWMKLVFVEDGQPSEAESG
ncbi:MAG: ParB N-terminal domain-containing protein [Desulfomonilaceae bacterium]